VRGRRDDNKLIFSRNFALAVLPHQVEQFERLVDYRIVPGADLSSRRVEAMFWIDLADVIVRNEIFEVSGRAAHFV
jgi:hypothetical protein